MNNSQLFDAEIAATETTEDKAYDTRELLIHVYTARREFIDKIRGNLEKGGRVRDISIKECSGYSDRYSDNYSPITLKIRQNEGILGQNDVTKHFICCTPYDLYSTLLFHVHFDQKGGDGDVIMDIFEREGQVLGFRCLDNKLRPCTISVYPYNGDD